MDPRSMIADPVGDAIHRVLEAERAAQADIARARAEADARSAAARGEALAVSVNADRRIAAVRASVDARLAAREAQVEAAIRVLRDSTPHPDTDDELVRQAAERIAAALTGEEAP